MNEREISLENGRILERKYLEIFEEHPEWSLAKLKAELGVFMGVPIPGDTFEIIEGNRMRGTLGVQVGGKGNRGLEVHKGDGF
jgi:hypothetical protein